MKGSRSYVVLDPGNPVSGGEAVSWDIMLWVDPALLVPGRRPVMMMDEAAVLGLILNTS